ncbi:lamin tail domain-containing protein [Pseudosporangium ferrugineum]|uniref:Lamin tail-like protein n=1 Tax=Pseudosporangium ferrugineum TaxID=439699 RepID=A0A2T0SDP1_9ACTN|nr:lamin tail domain-containing protein [Pseudosporangium ferrugineum]PRY31536.1 lamin tail-like protein [Pseudosporangium ferrugineum]
MRARKTALFAALGCAATLGLAAPAAAADAPTITAPASRQGYGPITLSGTAPAGSTVELYESAYVFNDFYASPDYNRGGFVTTTASASGQWSLSRILDSGFRFYVKAGGAESRRISVAMGIVPTMTLSAQNGTVNVNLTANPTQPGLRVHIQRGAGGVWADVATGYTAGDAAIFSTTLSGQGSGTKYYRAVIDADADNNLLKGQTETVEINVGNGSGSGGGSTPTPTTPTPTTPAPTTPAPAIPAVKAGDVQFSKIQYNSPGTDSGSNKSLVAEWVRLTNKTSRTINLKGWTVRDASGKVYTISGDYRLGARKYLYVHTGKGTNGRPDSQHRYWNRTGYVWNNGGDTAYLRTNTGKSIDSCKWGKGSGVTYC